MGVRDPTVSRGGLAACWVNPYGGILVDFRFLGEPFRPHAAIGAENIRSTLVHVILLERLAVAASKLRQEFKEADADLQLHSKRSLSIFTYSNAVPASRQWIHERAGRYADRPHRMLPRSGHERRHPNPFRNRARRSPGVC